MVKVNNLRMGSLALPLAYRTARFETLLTGKQQSGNLEEFTKYKYRS